MSALPQRPRNSVPLSLPAPKLPPALVASLPIRSARQMRRPGSDFLVTATVHVDRAGSSPPPGEWIEFAAPIGLEIRLKFES